MRTAVRRVLLLLVGQRRPNGDGGGRTRSLPSHRSFRGLRRDRAWVLCHRRGRRHHHRHHFQPRPTQQARQGWWTWRARAWEPLREGVLIRRPSACAAAAVCRTGRRMEGRLPPGPARYLGRLLVRPLRGCRWTRRGYLRWASPDPSRGETCRPVRLCRGPPCLCSCPVRLQRRRCHRRLLASLTWRKARTRRLWMGRQKGIVGARIRPARRPAALMAMAPCGVTCRGRRLRPAWTQTPRAAARMMQGCLGNRAPIRVAAFCKVTCRRHPLRRAPPLWAQTGRLAVQTWPRVLLRSRPQCWRRCCSGYPCRAALGLPLPAPRTCLTRRRLA